MNKVFILDCIIFGFEDVVSLVCATSRSRNMFLVSTQVSGLLPVIICLENPDYCQLFLDDHSTMLSSVRIRDFLWRSLSKRFLLRNLMVNRWSDHTELLILYISWSVLDVESTLTWLLAIWKLMLFFICFISIELCQLCKSISGVVAEFNTKLDCILLFLASLLFTTQNKNAIHGKLVYISPGNSSQ